MAVTAFLVVRLGRVWEDARSLALILLLQFVAISLSLDELCSTNPRLAAGLLLGGLGFSSLVSEALLHGLRIKLPGLFRLPYYVLLGTFFAYPLFVAPRRLVGVDFPRSWRIYLFLVLIGLVFLLLIPAVRRGAAYVANGTPWEWPWFPLSAFGLLAVAAGVRSHALAYNFHMVGAGMAFGAYYLAPLLLAVLILLAELSLAGPYRHLRWFVTAAARRSSPYRCRGRATRFTRGFCGSLSRRSAHPCGSRSWPWPVSTATPGGGGCRGRNSA